jgi:hypothetical protein
MAETKKDTLSAFDAFVETYQVKYERAVDGHNQLPKLIPDVKFADGIDVIGDSAVSQAQAA